MFKKKILYSLFVSLFFGIPKMQERQSFTVLQWGCNRSWILWSQLKLHLIVFLLRNLIAFGRNRSQYDGVCLGFSLNVCLTMKYSNTRNWWEYWLSLVLINGRGDWRWVTFNLVRNYINYTKIKYILLCTLSNTNYSWH